MMDSLQKFAGVIPYNHQNWMVGGTWSAGGRFPKKISMVKQTKEEQFPLDRSYATWIKEEKQAAWFVFPEGKPPLGEDGKKPKALYPLAWVVLQRMHAGQMPWRGLFRLPGDSWWFVAVDANGAVHPRWDILISDVDKTHFFAEHRAEIAAFPNEVFCETPEESFAWLFGDEVSGSIPRALPALVRHYQARKLMLLGGLVAVLGGAGLYGLHLWRQHEAQLEAAHQRETMAARAYAAAHDIAAQSAADSAMIARVNAAWLATPRPWQSGVSWATAIHACASNFGGLNTVSKDGWTLSVLSCELHGAVMSVHKTWVRSSLATVFHAPKGRIGKSGNKIVSVSTVTLPVFSHGNIPVKAEAEKEWMGLQQRWAGILAVSPSAMQSFAPPVPAFVPAAERKKLHPPALWNMNPVVISSSALPVEPLWPVLKTRGFMPKSIEALLTHSGISWVVTGIQYAN
ncbi:type 4b pilus protein PilO2 [Acidithiobacillus sp. MC6.1]|nr:type 4b pilus protein PilO2 [Acidithiobacillus sp. MC6.1]